MMYHMLPEPKLSTNHHILSHLSQNLELRMTFLWNKELSEIDSVLKYHLLRAEKQNDIRLDVKLLQLLSDGGFKILEEHKRILHHGAFTPSKKETSTEAKDGCRDKSLLSDLQSDHSKHVDLLDIAAAYIKKKNDFDKTPLHLSAVIGDTELVDICLKAGANVDAKDMCKFTALHCSAWCGHKDVVEILLKAGATVDAEDCSKKTPLYLSAEKGHTEVIDILLKAIAAVNDKDTYFNKTPLHLSGEKEHTEVAEILLKAGATANVEDSRKQTLLHLSVKRGHAKVVKILLNAGANPNVEYSRKQTPLHLSAERGHAEVVEILLNAGATPNVEDSYKQTPLHLSAERGHAEVVEILLNAGATPNVEDSYKQTPLHLSAERAHAEVVKILLNAGAIANVEDNRKQTPLHLSVERGHAEVVKILLNAGATPNAEFNVIKRLYEDSSLNKGETTDNDHSEPNTLKQHLEDDLATYSLKHIEEGETSHSHDVKTEFSARITLMPPQINISSGKKRIITNRPDPQLHMRKHFIPTISEAVVHQERIVADNDDSSSSDKDSSEGESSGSSDSGASELSNIRQQVEVHWAKFFPEHIEGGETRHSHDLISEFPAGIALMPPKINISSEKKQIITNSPDPQLHMRKHFIPTISEAVVHQERIVADKDDSSSSDKDSSEEESSGSGDSSASELSNIRQQVEDHWVKFAPEHVDGLESSHSHDKTEFPRTDIKIETGYSLSHD